MPKKKPIERDGTYNTDTVPSSAAACAPLQLRNAGCVMTRGTNRYFSASALS